jgi:serine/threonine protein kinase
MTKTPATPAAVPSIPSQALCAAEMLEGVELPNGWKVAAKVPPSAVSTGGNFSVPYYVERVEGKKTRRAFLKALNFRRLAAAPDFARAVQQHITAFNFERDTLTLCKDKKLKRVALLLDAGECRTPNNPLPVCYIVFELAEGGDARKQLAKLGKLDVAWTLRTLHQIAVGLQQLHGEGIAHQDVKPSNVLFFEAFGAKLTDLGCADTQTNPAGSPRGSLAIAGDPTYAPPELFYNEFAADWKVRRLGCDLYLLGSLIVFFFTGGASMNSILQAKIHTDHTPIKWTNDYRSVLPYVRDAFEQALAEIEPSIPDGIRPRVMEILRWLCEPDPKRRGHPLDLDRSQFNLERVISAFNLLAAKAEHGLI